jgi:hypothetical protein
MIRQSVVTTIRLVALLGAASAIPLKERVAVLPSMWSRDDIQYFPEVTDLPLTRQAIADYRASQAELND